MVDFRANGKFHEKKLDILQKSVPSYLEQIYCPYLMLTKKRNGNGQFYSQKVNLIFGIMFRL